MLRRMILLLALLALAFPSLVFAQELPPVTFPEPTGPWAVGRNVLHLVDETRLDTYTSDPNDHRELMVYVWYPADPALDAPAATWLGPEMSPVVADMYGLPLAFLDLVKVHALDNVPVADSASSYPVLLMSHGGDSSHPLLYTAFAEELASHGYMVLGIAHTHNALVTVFPDGRVVPMHTEGTALYSSVPADAPVFDQFQGSWDHCHTLLSLMADDAIFVLDQLESVNASHPLLAGRLDLAHIGMFGHSFGGATSVEVLAHDSRVLAAADLDGDLWSDYSTGLPGALLMITEEGVRFAEPTENYTDEELASVGITPEQYDIILRPQLDAGHIAYVNAGIAYSVMINEARHLNFGDNGLLAPLFPDFGEDLGPIDPVVALRIMNDYLLAFFGQYLKGNTSDLLAGIDAPAEVVFDYRLAE